MSSLLRETELTSAQDDTVQMIVSSGELLQTVVNDVLDYSKLESGNVDIVIRRCNLQDTLNAVVYSLDTKCISNNVIFRTYYDPTLGEYMKMDSRRLQQILYNLLGSKCFRINWRSMDTIYLLASMALERIKNTHSISIHFLCA